MNYQRLKIWALILILSFTFLTFGYLAGERIGLVLMFFVSIVLNGMLFFWGD